MAMQWTDKAVATLTRGWRDGLSSGQIARELGDGATRSAVARKRSRCGLEPRVNGGVAQAVNGRNNIRRTFGRGASPGRPKGVALAALLGPLIGSTPRPWTLRLYGECCFPVDGEFADTRSCCLPVEREAGLYCAGHLAILAGRPWPPVELEGLDG